VPALDRRGIARELDHRIAGPARSLGRFERAAPDKETSAELPERRRIGSDVAQVFVHVADVDAHDPVSLRHRCLPSEPAGRLGSALRHATAQPAGDAAAIQTSWACWVSRYSRTAQIL